MACTSSFPAPQYLLLDRISWNIYLLFSSFFDE